MYTSQQPIRYQALWLPSNELASRVANSMAFVNKCTFAEMRNLPIFPKRLRENVAKFWTEVKKAADLQLKRRVLDDMNTLATSTRNGVVRRMRALEDGAGNDLWVSA